MTGGMTSTNIVNTLAVEMANCLRCRDGHYSEGAGTTMDNLIILFAPQLGRTEEGLRQDVMRIALRINKGIVPTWT